MLQSVVHLIAARSNAPDVVARIMGDFLAIMESGDPTKAGELLKPEKRGRGRPKMKNDDDPKKHRDLGSYNLFVMKAQNVAGSDVKNHRAFMALIGSFWKVCVWKLLHCLSSILVSVCRRALLNQAHPKMRQFY